jgi:hypothetical protein
MARRERDPLANLEALARATDGLRPTNDFVDGVMATVEPASATAVLAKTQRETANLAPSDDFIAAVMQSVGQGRHQRAIPESNWQSGVARFSRFALMSAAAAAAVSLWLSSQAQSSFDAAILEDVASIEVDE